MRIAALLFFAAAGLLSAPGFIFAAGSGTEYFDQQIAPILEKNCVRCHNNELDDGGISFQNRDSLLRDRPDHGPAVVPGQPEKSSLARAIQHTGEIQMPPGKKLEQRDIDALIEWIRMGAAFGKRHLAPGKQDK